MNTTRCFIAFFDLDAEKYEVCKGKKSNQTQMGHDDTGGL